MVTHGDTQPDSVTPPPHRPPGADGPSIRGAVPSLVIDGLLPFLTYVLLTSYAPHLSQVIALGLSATFPSIYGLATIVRRRHLDIIGALVLVGIAVSIVATLVGGDPKLLLIRESFVTGALGMVCLTSLVWPRPMMFYIGRQFSAGEDPVKIAEFNALWQYPRARHTFRVMTIVWAIGWMSEFALRVVMVWTLSIPEVLAISPFVFNGITIALIAWSIVYGRRQWKVCRRVQRECRHRCARRARRISVRFQRQQSVRVRDRSRWTVVPREFL